MTASRVSINKMRKIRIFSPDAYVSLDYDKKQALLVRKSPRLTSAELARAAGGGADLTALAGADFGDLLSTDMLPIDDAEPLKAEIRSFLAAASGDAPPGRGRAGGQGARARGADSRRHRVPPRARPNRETRLGPARRPRGPSPRRGEHRRKSRFRNGFRVRGSA